MKRGTSGNVAVIAVAMLAAVFLVTGATAAQLTADQLAAMRARAEESRKFLEQVTEQMMAESAARAAARPPIDPIAAQRAADAAAAAREAWFLQEIAPWIQTDERLPDGQAVDEAKRSDLAKLKLLELSDELSSRAVGDRAAVDRFIKQTGFAPWFRSEDG
jgi:hypothetical protein